MESLITDQDQPLRSACDRCHVHKVRCSLSVQNEDGTSMNKPCSRCLKAQVPCVVGLRGKVGRPAKNMKRKEPSREDPHQHRAPPAGCWVGPDAGPDGGPGTAAHPCLQSPRLCPTPDTSPFSFNFIEIDNREPSSSTLPPGLGTPFPQDFGFGSFASRDHDGDTYFQEPFLATACRSSVASDGNDVLESGLNDAPTTPFPYIDAWGGVRDQAQDSNAQSHNQCESVSQTPSGGQQTPTPIFSTSPPAGTRSSSHERLCRISLRISEAAAGFAQDSASASVGVALKGVVGLASELNETARQILVQQQGQDPSARSSSTAEKDSGSNMPAREISNGEGGGRSPLTSSASSVTAYEHPSSSSSSNCTRHTPGEALDPALVFLLLACYAGFLSVFELVLERLWAQCGGPSREEEGKTGRGTRFLSTLLETSLAVHTVHCLFKVLREALFPEDLRDSKNDAVSDSGIALVSSGRGPVARGTGRGTAWRLLESTCGDIRQRGEDILKSTEELQQRLVR